MHLLESNGHFGMVDSGEDWDYPSASTGSKYPYRYGITTNEGYEQQVVHYLKQLGVEKLDFTLQRMRTVITSDLDPVDGDTEKIAEQVKRVKIDLLKLPHHGWIITIHRIS